MTSEHVQMNLAICFARVFHRFDRNSRSSDINFKICRGIIRSVRENSPFEQFSFFLDTKYQHRREKIRIRKLFDISCRME